MIGRRVESHRGLPWGTLLVLAVGLGLLAAGAVLKTPPLAIGAIWPLAFGTCLLAFGRERPFAAEFTAEAIAVEGPGEPSLVSYESIKNVFADGRPVDPATFRGNAATIVVHHDGGRLRIPRGLDAPAHEVYGFLAGKVPLHGGRDVNPALAEYLARQVEQFGPERVWSNRAEPKRALRPERPRFRAFSLSLVLAAIAWIALAASGQAQEGWGFAGVPAAVLGGIFLLASFSESTPYNMLIKGWKQASVVIGPRGLAMVQGDIQGAIGWDELLDVTYRSRPRSLRLSYADGLTGIILKVKGSRIVIADIYDRPLYVIYDRLLASSSRAEPVLDDLEEV
jgi:hypothetical protein